MIFKAFSY